MLTEMRLEECELDCVLIGKRVRTARKAKKVTQEELSEHCGCTPTHICNLENGKIGVSLELLFKISIYLDKSNIRDKRDVDFFLHAFVFGSIIQLFYMLSVYGLDIITVIQESEQAIRIGDEVSNSNMVGLSFAYGAVISVHFMRQAIKNRKMRWIFYLVIALVASVFTFLSGSRKATLVILGGFLCVYLFGGSQSKNILKKIRTVLIALLLLILLYWVLTNIPLFSVVNERLEALIGGVLGNEALDHSSEERFSFIAIGWQAFLSYPFIGQGIYSSYRYFGTYSHNNFIEVLMNTGLIGFILFYTPYVVYGIRMLFVPKKDSRYGLMLFLFAWLLFGAYGMVTYYDKMSMSLMMIVTAWTDLSRREKNELQIN